MSPSIYLTHLANFPMEDESDEVLPVLATLGFSEAFGGVGAVTVGAAGAAGLTTAEGSLGFGGGFALNEGRHFDKH